MSKGSTNGYTSPEAARLSGIAYGRLDYWARTGFLPPSVSDAHGRGTERLYSFTDVVALRVARELRDAGISLQALRQVTEYLRHRSGLEQPLSQTFLVTDGADVFERTGEAHLSTLQRPGQVVLFVVDLSRAVAEVKAAVAA